MLFILSVVFLENFATWATSASDRRKYEYTPLQVGGGPASEGQLGAGRLPA